MVHGETFLLNFEERYDLQALVGRGGMGEVYAAYDKMLNRQVAIKLVRCDHSHDPQMRQRFYKGARAILLLREPHIVEAYDFGMTGNEQLYLSMELVRGKSLFELRHTPLPLSSILDVVCQLLQALGHAHARGIVHRDIKTENVLVSLRQGALFAKLVDFGLAMRPANSLYDAAETVTLGTPGYIAPEQIAVGMAEACPATDIYSVGAILYELVCGKLAFEGDCGETILKAQIDGVIRPFVWREHLKNTPENIQKDMERIIRYALSPYVWERYLSAAEFRRELEKIKVPVMPLPKTADMEELWKYADENLDEPGVDEDYASKIRVLSAIDRVVERAESVTCLDDDHVEICEETEVQADAFGVCQCPGREKLWMRLDMLAKTSLLGVGNVFCMAGKFGVGKSYFLNKIAAAWSSLNACILQISCVRTDESDDVELIRQSAGVFWSLLGTLLGTPETDDAASASLTRAGRVEHRLRKLGFVDISFLNAMKLFMEKPPLDPTTSLTPALIVMQNVERLVQIVIGSLQKPLFILIDDIQRCSEALFDFLLQMKRRIALEKILIVVSYDPTEVHALFPGRLKIAQNVKYQALLNDGETLEALKQPEMVRVLMSGCGVSQTLATHLAKHAWGNLYYAVTTLGQLRHDARLVRNAEGELEFAPNDSGNLPLSREIRVYFKNRVDAIGREMGLNFVLYREILLRIAILGDCVDMAEMEKVWSHEEDVALVNCWFEALAAWCEYGILRVEGTKTRRVVFCEPWLARATEMLASTSKVRELHRRAAVIYEKCYPDPDSDQLTSLAHHWEVARERVAFVCAGRRAAVAQRRDGNLVKAQHIFQDMTRVWIKRHECVECRSLDACIDWPALFWKYGQNSFLLGDEHAIARVHELLEALTKKEVSSPKTLLELFDAHVCMFHGDWQNAKIKVQKMLAQASVASDIQNEVERTYARILIREGGHKKAIPILEALRQKYLQKELRMDAATVAALLGHLYWADGNVTLAQEMDRVACDELAGMHGARGMTEREAMSAWRACVVLPGTASQDRLEAVAGTFEAYGDVWHEQALFPMRFVMAILMHRSDHIPGLLERAQKIKRDYPGMAAPPVEGFGLIYDGFECLAEGMTFEARHAFDDAKGMMDDAHALPWMAFVFWLRALFAFDEGDDERGGKFLQTAREMVTLDSPWIAVAFDLACAMRYNLQNKSNMAAEYAEKALHTAKTLGAVALRSAACIVLLEALVSLCALDAVRTCMAYYKKVVFPVRLAAVFEHMVERIMDKLQKLPASFSALVMPALQTDKPAYDDIATDSDGLLSCQISLGN